MFRCSRDGRAWGFCITSTRNSEPNDRNRIAECEIEDNPIVCSQVSTFEAPTMKPVTDVGDLFHGGK